MRHLRDALCLVLLLLAAQQGAVVHELSHINGIHGPELRIDAGALADANCALCPVFAQVLTPACSHAFGLPSLVRATLERSGEPRIDAADAAIPTPRSRGPPSLS